MHQVNQNNQKKILLFSPVSPKIRVHAFGLEKYVTCYCQVENRIMSNPQPLFITLIEQPRLGIIESPLDYELCDILQHSFLEGKVLVI